MGVTLSELSSTLSGVALEFVFDDLFESLRPSDLLGTSWASWDPLGFPSGPSWCPLGVFWGPFGLLGRVLGSC